MLRRTTPWILGLVFVATSSPLAQKTLTAVEAKAHVGEQTTVCGKVVSTRWAESSHGSPTFLNFDQPYPDQVLRWSYGAVIARSSASLKPPIEASTCV